MFTSALQCERTVDCLMEEETWKLGPLKKYILFIYLFSKRNSVADTELVYILLLLLLLLVLLLL